MGKLIVFSGAGLSAESGLTTFRDADGLWAIHDINKVCNFETWQHNYDAVHEFHNSLRAAVGAAEPNSAHRFIAQWQTQYETIILTQNTDDLLERAGCSDVVHLHGSVREMVCTACRHVWDIGYLAWNSGDSCPSCNSHKAVKPNIIFFNERAPSYHFFKRAFRSLEEGDVVLVTGTSSRVIAAGRYLMDYPGYKIYNALEPSPTPESYDESILLPATVAFPAIDRTLRDRLRQLRFGSTSRSRAFRW